MISSIQQEQQKHNNKIKINKTSQVDTKNHGKEEFQNSLNTVREMSRRLDRQRITTLRPLQKSSVTGRMSMP